MSDNTITAATLAKRFAHDKREAGITKTLLAAKTIMEGVNEPDPKVAEIANKVIDNYEIANNEKDIVVAIGQAMEYTVIEYSPDATPENGPFVDSSPEPKQIELGLLRGQDALYGARRVVRGLSTVEVESGKINDVIKRRTPSKTQTKRPASKRTSKSAQSNKTKKQPAQATEAQREQEPTVTQPTAD